MCFTTSKFICLAGCFLCAFSSIDVCLLWVTMLAPGPLVIHYKLYIFSAELLSRQSFLIPCHAIDYSWLYMCIFLLNCITFFSLFPYLSRQYWILMLLCNVVVVYSRVISPTDLERIISLLLFRSLINILNNTNTLRPNKEPCKTTFNISFDFDNELVIHTLC